MSDTNFLVTLVLMVVMPVTLVTCAMVFRQIYTPDKILAQVAKKLGYEGNETDYALSAEVRGQGTRNETLYVKYRVRLPQEAATLTLRPEGAGSAIRSQFTGEISLGDQDFDDYFWVESAPLPWLTTERRVALIDLFESHEVKAIREGWAEGQVRCDRAPWTGKSVARRIQQIGAAAGQLNSPVGVKIRPQGWVGARQRTGVAMNLMFVAFLAFLPAGMSLLSHGKIVGADAYLTTLKWLYAFAGIALTVCGISILAAHRRALGWARISQVLCKVALLASVGLALYTFGEDKIGTFLVFGVLAYLASWFVDGNYLAVTQLPLRTEAPAEQHRLG